LLIKRDVLVPRVGIVGVGSSCDRLWLTLLSLPLLVVLVCIFATVDIAGVLPSYLEWYEKQLHARASGTTSKLGQIIPVRTLPR